MTLDPVAAVGTVRLRKVLPGTPEEVFRAWSDPEWMRHWLTPVGEATAQVDLQVGGQFRLVMAGDGMTIEHTGEYLEVDPPHRLSFSWRSPFTADASTVVTVVIRAAGEAESELELTHEHLPEGAAESHGQGWGTMLDRLTELIRGDRWPST